MTRLCMKNIANADRPKSSTAMLPPRPLRKSGKVPQTDVRPERRDGKSRIPTLNQTFADSQIRKRQFLTFGIVEIAPVTAKVGNLRQFEPEKANKLLPYKHRTKL